MGKAEERLFEGHQPRHEAMAPGKSRRRLPASGLRRNRSSTQTAGFGCAPGCRACVEVAVCVYSSGCSYWPSQPRCGPPPLGRIRSPATSPTASIPWSPQSRRPFTSRRVSCRSDSVPVSASGALHLAIGYLARQSERDCRVATHFRWWCQPRLIRRVDSPG